MRNRRTTSWLESLKNHLETRKYSVIFNNAKLFEETKNKDDTDPNLVRDFCSTAFLSKPYGYGFFIRAFPHGCGSALARSMSITIFLISGPFDNILSRPFKGTFQMSVFRQDTALDKESEDKW